MHEWFTLVFDISGRSMGRDSAFCKSHCPGLGALDRDLETDFLKGSLLGTTLRSRAPMRGWTKQEGAEREGQCSCNRGSNQPPCGSSGARTVFKDVPTEAMGPGLWSPHKLVIEPSCDQSTKVPATGRMNTSATKKESVQYITASPTYSHFFYG